MAFHGNLQVAIREAKTLVEAGIADGFLRADGRRDRAAGRHVQRVLACRGRSISAANARRSICESGRSSQAAASCADPRGRGARHGFSGAGLAIFGSEDLFDASGDGRETGRSARTWHIFRRPVRSEAGRLRGARGARRRAVSRAARDRAGRSQGRLHAARVRGRQQALRAADAHGSGPAVSRRGRSRAARSTAWAARRGPAPRRASRPRCATWRRSC